MDLSGSIQINFWLINSLINYQCL